MFKFYKQMRKINKSKLSDDEWYDKDDSGRGIIDVGAENYDDIFSYYDLEGENTLDWEFIDFIEKKADAIPLKDEISIHFHVKGANEEKKEEIDKAIKNHYKRQLKSNHRTLHRDNLMCLYLLIMGLLAFGIYVALYLIDAFFVFQYMFDIVAWVFFWETVDVFFIRRRVIKNEMLKQFRFIRSDIRILEYKDKKKKQRISNNSKYLNKILKNVQGDKKRHE